MGRYYNGDIDGKFWFAVQDSDAADRFGSKGTQPNYLNYYFDENQLEKVEKELKVIKENIGEYWDKLDDFFNSTDFYNEEGIIKALGIDDEEKVSFLISEYADYGLGKKIYNCIKESGSCEFEAEC